MSGAEVIAVLGVISSAISIIDATIKISQALRDAQGLHETFRRVAGSLPLVLELLTEAKQELADSQSVSTNNVQMVIESCVVDAQMLERCFESLVPETNTSPWRRFSKAVKGVRPGREHKYQFIKSQEKLVSLRTESSRLVSPGAQVAQREQVRDSDSSQNLGNPSKEQSISKFLNAGGKVLNQGDDQWIQHQNFHARNDSDRSEQAAFAPMPPYSTTSAAKFQNVGSIVGNQGDNQRIGMQTVTL